MQKFDLVNPIIGKLATQVKASKLTDYELTKKNYKKVKLTKFSKDLIDQNMGQINVIIMTTIISQDLGEEVVECQFHLKGKL